MIQFLQKELNNHDTIPSTSEKQNRLLRKLMNIRPGNSLPAEILKIQDDFLQEKSKEKTTTTINEIQDSYPNDLYLWQGDITTLAVDGIVNAANSDLLGCFQPNHNCIDNVIHTNAGMQVRIDCQQIMAKQGRKEAVGKAKITKAYNLPSQYIIHTVGPYIKDTVSPMSEELLASCYHSCLEIADQHQLKDLAFCSISTGVFRFPKALAAKIAVQTVVDYKEKTGSDIQVIFNVFSAEDAFYYQNILQEL